MKKLYFLLMIVGFAAPNIFVVQESISTGNYLLWRDPAATISGMFSNTIATAFTVDLLVVVLIFFIWTFVESKRHKMQVPWLVWILTLLFGMAGTFPLFLYFRERSLEFSTK